MDRAKVDKLCEGLPADFFFAEDEDDLLRFEGDYIDEEEQDDDEVRSHAEGAGLTVEDLSTAERASTPPFDEMTKQLLMELGSAEEVRNQLHAIDTSGFSALEAAAHNRRLNSARVQGPQAPTWQADPAPRERRSDLRHEVLEVQRDVGDQQPQLGRPEVRAQRPLAHS